MIRWPTKATRTGVLVRRERLRHGNCRRCPLSLTKTVVEFQEQNGNHRWTQRGGAATSKPQRRDQSRASRSKRSLKDIMIKLCPAGGGEIPEWMVRLSKPLIYLINCQVWL